MHESNDLLEGNDHAIGNRNTPLELALTLHTMGEFWTHDAFDSLRVSLLFAHWLPPALCYSSSWYLIIYGCTEVLPARSQKSLFAAFLAPTVLVERKIGEVFLRKAQKNLTNFSRKRLTCEPTPAQGRLLRSPAFDFDRQIVYHWRKTIFYLH